MRTPSFDLSNAVTTRRLITDLTRLSKDTPAAEPAKKADALYTLGLLYRATDDKAGAEKMFLEAASLYRSAGDRRPGRSSPWRPSTGTVPTSWGLPTPKRR